MATQSPNVSGKRIVDLKVTELRSELEQRGLETKGLKADLVKRLEKALLADEGGTPVAGTPASSGAKSEEKPRSRKSTPRRREVKNQVQLKQAAVEIADGGPDLYAAATEISLEYSAHKEGDDTIGLSEPLFAGANDSEGQDFNAGEEDITETNPDQYFQDDAYVQDEISMEGGSGPIDEENQNIEEGEEFEYMEEEGENEPGNAYQNSENADEEYNEAENGYEEAGEMANEEEEMDDQREEIYDEEGDQYKDIEDEEGNEKGDEGVMDGEDVAAEDAAEEQYYEEDAGEVVEDIDEGVDDDLIDREGEVEGDESNVNEKQEANESSDAEGQEPAIDTEESPDNSEVNPEGLKDDKPGKDVESDIEEGKDQGDEEELCKEEKSESGDKNDTVDKVTDTDANKEHSLAGEEKVDTENKDGGNKELKSKGKLGLEEGAESKAEKSKVADTSSKKVEPTASESDGKSDKKADVKEDCKSAEKQSTKDDKKEIIRSVWISGLSSVTRAVDLKTTFSKYGKVVGAKVVTSARSPGTNCFGFVTMSSFEEATKCIETLNKTEIHGKIITVERAKHDPTPKKPPPKTDKKTDDKKAPVKSSRQQKQGSSSKREDGKDAKSSESHKKGENRDSKSRSEKKKDERGRSDSKSDRRPSDRRRRSGSRSRHRSRSHDRRKSNSHQRSKSRDNKRITDSAESNANGAEKKGKSVEELKKERQAKIDKERKLRDERRRKEREREKELREERRRAQEARERERRERAKREEERMRRERDRQREIERERDLRKKRERERLVQERREKEREREEKERIERERKEREAQLERERIERERLKEEREERERAEKERVERERKERERVERDRLRKEKEELERIRAERERLERERLEVERRYALKRAGPPGKREVEVVRGDDRYTPEQKKPALDSPKGQGGRPQDFFGGSHGMRNARGPNFDHLGADDKLRPDVGAHPEYPGGKRDTSRHSSRDEGHSRGSLPRSGREPSPLGFPSGRGGEGSTINQQSHGGRRPDPGFKDDRRDDHSSRDYRRIVSSRDERDRSPRRPDVPRDVDRSRMSDGRHSDRGGGRSDRRSSRDGDGIQFYDMEEKPRDRAWGDSPELRNPPKTLNEILERAGVRGILGNAEFDQKLTMTVNDALSLAASRGPKSDSVDWRGDSLGDRRDERRGEGIIDRREIRREERHDDRRDERRSDRRDERLEVRRDDRHDVRRDDRHDDRHEDRRVDRQSASSRSMRIGQEPLHREPQNRHQIGFSRDEPLSRGHDIDLGMSRRAQELLAQAAITDARSRIPPSQQIPSRNPHGREPVSRDAMERGFPQRGPDAREPFPRSIARNDIQPRGFQAMPVMPQQVLQTRQHPVVGSRPSSQDSWNRSRNVVPGLGGPGNFQLPGAMIGSSPIRREAMPHRGMNKPGVPEHGIPSHIRRF